MWQDDCAADDRGARADHQGDGEHRRPGGQQPAAQGPGYRHGVPELCSLPAYERLRKHGVRTEDARGREAGRGPSRRRGGAHPRPHGQPEEEAAHAVRRAATAGRDGAGDRTGAQGVSDGRAALEPRREAPRRDARRDLTYPARPRRDDHLRHARSDGSDDHGRPGRGDARRSFCSRSTRRRTCTRARRTCSWPSSSARPR